MKKVTVLLTLLLTSTLFCQAQDFSVIKNEDGYLLVKSQETTSKVIDSLQLKILTITTTSKELVPMYDIKSNVKDLRILNKLIAENYEEISERKELLVDSMINNYNIHSPWTKERFKKTYEIRQGSGIIYCSLKQSPKKISFNFEFLLLLGSLIFIIYLHDCNVNKVKEEENNLIMAVFFLIFLILLVSWQRVGLIMNIIDSFLISCLLLSSFIMCIKMQLNIKVSIILIYAFLSFSVQHDIMFSVITLSVGFTTIIILWLIKKRRYVLSKKRLIITS